MRILFIAPLPPGITGQSLACQVLFESLVKDGHHLDVININKSSFKSGEHSWRRIFESLGYALRALVAAPRADIIYFTVSESLAGNLKDLLIYLACFPFLHKMIIHLHGGAGMRVLLRKRPAMATINRFFLSRLGRIILLGERHRDIFTGIDDKKLVAVVPNFAQDELFTDFHQVEEKFAARSILRVLFLSNLLPGKGYDDLLAAYEQLSEEEREKIRLDFAGGFESESARADFVGRISPLPQVHYHGVVAGVRKVELLRQAHLFALPTYYPYEGQPISILEAYATGCAVMTTDHSGIFDVFDPTKCGVAVEVRSPASIASGLRLALSDRGKLLECARHNLKLASSDFKAEQFTSRLKEIFGQVGRS